MSVVFASRLAWAPDVWELLGALDRFASVDADDLAADRSSSHGIWVRGQPDAILATPDLTRALDAMVVEFGNSAYKAVCDRFILEGAPVPRADLVQIWRQIGDPTWNALVYEQFYRTIRAVNRTRPATRRIRILRLPCSAPTNTKRPTMNPSKPQTRHNPATTKPAQGQTGCR